MFKLLTVYIVSVLILIATATNVNIYNAKLHKSDYFLMLTPGLNTFTAIMAILVSMDKMKKIHQIQD